MTAPGGGLIAGRYEPIKPLGKGSFGHTYLATDHVAARQVAIKVLDPRAVADWKAFERVRTGIAGDVVQILYLPGDGYDSVIISAD